jgi:chromosome segregation ATPase
MKGVFSVAVLGLAATSAQGMTLRAGNPIRRVVSMLQKIEAKVQAEGEKETELHEKAMCECKNGKASYTQSISDGEAKVEQLAAGLKSGEGALSQLKTDLVNHKADREAAKDALAEALGMREKEASAYGGVKAEAEANMAAVGKAVKAISKGAASAFLQTDAAQVLRDLANSDMGTSFSTLDRTQVLSFLSNQDGSEGSGEIVGILKQLGDEMLADLKEATTAENKAIANYNDLVETKNAEVAELTKQIEDKITRVGETGVAIEDMKADASDTADKLVEDKKFLVTLTGECEKKEQEWEAISKERQAELLALADTIKMLNDDDALEIFKKSTAGSASSFLQLQFSTSAVKARALATIHDAQKKGTSRQLDLIALALHGKSADMSKVIKMIDEMVAVLKTEQTDDDEKKAYCATALDEAEDKLKGFQRQIQDSDAAIKDAKGSIADLDGEMTALVGGLYALDKSVKDATEQRKKENEAYKVLKASNAAAGALIKKAKDRLAEFYGLQLSAAANFLQVRQSEATPSFIQTKKAETGGVIAMMDTLAGDLEKETAIATANENDAQADYEKLVADSKTMRKDNSAILEDKTAAKADAQGALETHEDNMQGQFEKMKGANDQLKATHKDCDWLLSNYETRTAARSDEIDAMGKAKAVLNGADFVQE